ncbi:Uncharacterised protein [Lysinibacillus sphaericus]|uniref:Uncharacterized protein n=1 Tax=Lysinibacillus sphaericus TaxID=1421 RepID=A0AAJ4ZVN9_LYSSH|nr:Uncharacterised protein [Lysinibacillus sphaericus]
MRLCNGIQIDIINALKASTESFKMFYQQI